MAKEKQKPNVNGVLTETERIGSSVKNSVTSFWQRLTANPPEPVLD